MSLGQVSQSNAIPTENPENISPPEICDEGSTSMVNAFMMLKASEDRAYEARKKLQMMYSTQEKVFFEKKESQRKSHLFLEVADFSKRQKERKYRNLLMKSAQKKHMHETNQRRREDHKDFMRSYHENLFERNRNIYSEAKNRKKKHEQTIINNRMKDIERKKKKKQEFFLAKRQGRQFVDNYLENKRLISILQREEEAKKIMHKIEENNMKVNEFDQERTKVADKLQQFLEDSRVTSTKYSRIIQQAYPQEERVFRIKHKTKNKTQRI